MEKQVSHTCTDGCVCVSVCVFQVSTAEDNGVLLYNGDNEPIAVELHEGHVRVTYDPGNQPATTIYRCVYKHTPETPVKVITCEIPLRHL